MARLLVVFLLQLLFGTFRPCLLQRTSAGLRSVHPGDNITLHCDITVDHEIWWCHQSSEEMMVLVSARKGKVRRSFSFDYNVDKDHYDATEDGSSVSLVIIGVNETDLGLYYCGGRNGTQHIRFGAAISLNFAGDQNHQLDVPNNTTEISRHTAGCGHSRIMLMIAICAGGFCVLMSIICICVLCCGSPGKPASSCSHCRNEETDLQYASLAHENNPRASTAITSAPALDSVIYAGVVPQPSKHVPTFRA